MVYFKISMTTIMFYGSRAGGPIFPGGGPTLLLGSAISNYYGYLYNF